MSSTDDIDARLAAFNQGRSIQVDRVVWWGVCVCGHAADDHHGAVVQNQALVDAIGLGVVPVGGCEFYGCNEEEGLGEDGEIHCVRYLDAGHPDPAAHDAWRARLARFRAEQDQVCVRCSRRRLEHAVDRDRETCPEGFLLADLDAGHPDPAAHDAWRARLARFRAEQDQVCVRCSRRRLEHAVDRDRETCPEGFLLADLGAGQK